MHGYIYDSIYILAAQILGKAIMENFSGEERTEDKGQKGRNDKKKVAPRCISVYPSRWISATNPNSAVLVSPGPFRSVHLGVLEAAVLGGGE